MNVEIVRGGTGSQQLLLRGGAGGPGQKGDVEQGVWVAEFLRWERLVARNRGQFGGGADKRLDGIAQRLVQVPSDLLLQRGGIYGAGKDDIAAGDERLHIG